MKKLLLFFVVLSLFAFSTHATAQESTGAIAGTITLNDGSPLPGVSVMLTGTVFGKTAVVSSAEGHFRFLKLSPGYYKLTMTLTGFKTAVLDDVRVSVNATTDLKVLMEIGTIEQEVVVTGAASMTDARKVSVSRNVSTEQLQSLPVSRSMVEIINMAPGVLPPKPVVGGFSYGSWFAGYGTIGFKSEFNVDGAAYGSTYYPGEPPGNSWSINSERIEETKITTTGMDIHAVQGGVNVNFVSKRGGNAMSGIFYLNAIDRGLVSHKSPPSTVADRGNKGLIDNWKYGLTLGGPIVKDHLWYFASYGLVDDFRKNTDGSISRPQNFDLYTKANFQLFDKLMGEVSYQKGKYAGLNVLFIHAAEAWHINETRPVEVYAGQLNGTISDKLLVSGKFTYMNMFKQQITPGTESYFADGEAYNPPGRYYLYDNFYSPPYNVDKAGCWVVYNDKQKRPYFTVEANYFAEKLLGGDHELLLGVEMDAPKYVQGYYAPNQMFVHIDPVSDPSLAQNGRYNAWFNTYSYVIGPRASQRQGLFFQDVINFKKLAVSLGLRFDRMRWKWDPVTLPGLLADGSAISAWTQWTGSMDVAGGSTRWINTISPRLSATYDLSGGKGRDLIKLSFADYAGSITNLNFRNGFKAGYLRGEFTMPFYDANGNLVPDVGEYDTPTPSEIDNMRAVGIAEQAAWQADHPGTTPPWDYYTYPQWFNMGFSGNRLGNLGSASLATDFLSDDYTPDRVMEIVAGYERKLTSDIGVSVLASYKKEYNGTWARGYTGTPDDYELIPVQNNVVLGTDPTTGWDIYGLAPGTTVPAAAGYVVTNYKHVFDDFWGLQFLFKKLLTNHWMLDGSISLTKWTTHRSLEEQARDTLWDYYDHGCFTSANYASGQILANSRWSIKITGLYQFPYDISLSASIDGREGYPYNVWVSQFMSTNLPEYGSKYGDHRMSDVWNLQAKVSKVFNISDRVKLDVYALVYNLLDSMTPLLYNYTQVPTLNVPTSVMGERMCELGARIKF